MTQRYLAIETSSPRLSVAAGDEFKTLQAYEGPLQWRHADLVFEAMEQVLKKQRWTIPQLTGVAVATGPGSFTGIRIGLAVARTLGQSLRIPVVGINSLQILAAGMNGSEKRRVPMLDALRGHLFTACYEKKRDQWIARKKEQHVEARRWAAQLRPLAQEGPLRIAGDAWPIYQAEFRSLPIRRAPVKEWYPKASVLLDLARSEFPHAGPESYLGVLPFYLRQAAVQERQKRR